MNAQSPPTTDLPTLRRAIEGRDAVLLGSLYADDAQLHVVDRLHPPSAPLEVHGRDAIRAYYDDVCGRAMTHRIEQAVADGSRIAFTERCEYPDGVRVLCTAMLDLDGGKIARQVNVQAWDE